MAFKTVMKLGLILVELRVQLVIQKAQYLTQVSLNLDGTDGLIEEVIVLDIQEQDLMKETSPLELETTQVLQVL